jgi:1-acyl-sn-glycerol-3-phosphate acyltransferase
MSDTTINRPPRHTTPGIQLIIKAVAWIIIKLVARIDLKGMEHVPMSGPLVIVTNHLSSLSVNRVETPAFRQAVFNTAMDLS